VRALDVQWVLDAQWVLQPDVPRLWVIKVDMLQLRAMDVLR
jgi:hypothetical protein